MLERISQNMKMTTGWMNGVPSQTLLERVGKLARWMVIPAFLCLGVYVAVRRYSYAAPSRMQPALEIKPYPEFCKNAIEFARGQLKNKDIQPHLFATAQKGKDTYQPVNSEIAQLQTIYNERYEEIEKQLLEGDCWDEKDFQDKIHGAMAIAYTISCLTLEDLKDFQQELKRKGIDRTFEKCLTQQDSYQYRIFYECTWLYHVARARYQGVFNEFTHQKQLEPPETISTAWAEKFYIQGATQGRWRELYNDFCDRVRMYVEEDKLEKEDSRHVKWSQKDERQAEGSYQFNAYPTTLPT